MKSKYLPILLYVLEAFPLSATDLDKLGLPVARAFLKIPVRLKMLLSDIVIFDCLLPLALPFYRLFVINIRTANHLANCIVLDNNFSETLTRRSQLKLSNLCQKYGCNNFLNSNTVCDRAFPN